MLNSKVEKYGKSKAFNALKPEIIIFSKATSIVKHLPNRVPFEFKAKYLGLTLDSKLT